MQVIKCGMPSCKNYIVEEEAKLVYVDGKPISICEFCDDGTFDEVLDAGGNHGFYDKVEKIKRKRNRAD